MRDVVIAGNWKMNKTSVEALEFITDVKKANLSNFAAKKMIFAPTFILEKLVDAAQGMDITIGAQNFHQEDSGAFTGETSIEQLKSIGITTALIGHSERRQFFNETDKIVNQKLVKALAASIQPVLCIGETLQEREDNITNDVLETQLKAAFTGVDVTDVANIIVAYEPVWAIGTGLTASAEDANEACKFVRSVIAGLYGEVAESVVIQYGGSVSPGNVVEILSQSDIDGALVGGASLDPKSYLDLLK